MGSSINGDPEQWMVYFMGHPTQRDDLGPLGVPRFQERNNGDLAKKSIMKNGDVSSTNGDVMGFDGI